MRELGDTKIRPTVRLGAGTVALAVVVLAACSTTSSTSPPSIDAGTPASADTQSIGFERPASGAKRPPGLSTSTSTSTIATSTTSAPSTTITTSTVPPPTTVEEPPTTVAAPAAIGTERAPDERVGVAYTPPAPVVVPALEIPLAAVGTSSGDETARVQARLLELGFWLTGSDGDFGLTTTQAVMAFQKYHGIPATSSVDEQTASMMSAAGERANGRGDAGTLVEIDKSRQLLFIVVDGVATWTFNTSTGTEVPYETVNKKEPTKIERGDSVTPVGLYHTERERPEGWWAGDLGEIYRPKYFVGGIAVHGSNSIPNYPASHGCVRVSVPAMDFIWESDLIPLGTNVWVHGEIPAT